MLMLVLVSSQFLLDVSAVIALAYAFSEKRL